MYIVYHSTSVSESIPKTVDDATDSCDVVPFLSLLHSFRSEDAGSCLSVKKVKDESSGNRYITFLFLAIVDIKMLLSESDKLS